MDENSGDRSAEQLPPSVWMSHSKGIHPSSARHRMTGTGVRPEE